jgi:uncharacterized protein involved in exopolysaccharide biosynthesis
MDLVALSSRLARRWWLVAGLAAIAALGAATAGATGSSDHQTRIQFVLRPDASVTNDDLPGTLDALKSDGTLVQTVIGVLRNRAILNRAAADAEVGLPRDYAVAADARPGSTLITSTLKGPDRSVLSRLAGAYAREASTYVSASYSAYVLERLSTTSAPDSSGPGTAQVVIVALLLGAALGVALVAAELRLEPQVKRLAAARRAASREDEPDAEPEPEAEPERKPEPEAKPPPVARLAPRPQSRVPPSAGWRRDANGPLNPGGWRPAARRGEDEE